MEEKIVEGLPEYVKFEADAPKGYPKVYKRKLHYGGNENNNNVYFPRNGYCGIVLDIVDTKIVCLFD